MAMPSGELSAERLATLEAIVEHAFEGIITIDELGMIESLNPAAEAIFGYSTEELAGRNVNTLMPSPYHEEHDGYLANYRNTGEKKIIGIGREVVGKRKDGTEFPMDLAVSELKLTNKRMFTGFVRDITERKQAVTALDRLNAELEQRVEARTQQLHEAQEQLVRRERLATLGQLAGGVAHEIRNPMGVIRNAVYFLQQVQDDSDEDAADALAEISRGLANSDRIISELLDYARGPSTEPSVFPLDEAVDAGLEMVKIPSGISVSRPEPSSIHVNADRGQIERLFANLIQNAAQAMSGEGVLTVRCRRDNGDAIGEVTDTGKGIAADELEKVFEPLFTKRAKGIGLGLPLCRRYAEQNGGTLTAESKFGEGSTFTLSLPAATNHGESL